MPPLTGLSVLIHITVRYMGCRILKTKIINESETWKPGMGRFGKIEEV
jgi:hypothetical protein